MFSQLRKHGKDWQYENMTQSREVQKILFHREDAKVTKARS
jgi:hypothetical protein